MLKLVIIWVIMTSVVQANQVHNQEDNRHSELLKPETNAIDHGPSNYKSAHRLLGHQGEHRITSHGKTKKKATHSLNGSHHDSLDDMRLQDLSYNSSKGQHGIKKIKKDHHRKAESHHSEKYMKK